MNTSSLTGLVVVLAAAIWLGFFVPAWVKRGEKVEMVREATRQLKRQAKALKPKAKRGQGMRTARANAATQQVSAGPIDYRALYRAALAVGAQSDAATAASVDEGGWVPRQLPAPMHVGHVGTLEQPTLAQVTQLVPAAAARPEEAVIGENLDQILRRRRAV